MLPRFYDADGGAVLVDGHDVREYRLQSLRDQISLVDQQVRLFNASVAENIAYGLQPTPDEARIVEAAKLAHAWEFIERMPDGLRSEEHTSELQSLMRNSYAVFCLKKKKHKTETQRNAI